MENNIRENEFSRRYEKIKPIGEGGFGRVFYGKNRMTEEPLAIKEIELIESEERSDNIKKERALKEIDYLRAARHENLVEILDAYHEKGKLYICMEYLSGKDLRAHLKSRTYFSVSETIDIIYQCAQGLRILHRKEIIHRDIKPENIIFHEGRAVITDFGIAKNIGAILHQKEYDGEEKSKKATKNEEDMMYKIKQHKGISLTMTNDFIGTLYYASPEQVMGDKEINYSSDIYSLGSVMYEMLTGKTAVKQRTTESTVVKIISGKITPPRKYNKRIPVKIEEICMKMLSRRREDRYQSLDEFIEVLEREAFEYKKDVMKWKDIGSKIINYLKGVSTIYFLGATAVGCVLHYQFVKTYNHQKYDMLKVDLKKSLEMYRESLEKRKKILTNKKNKAEQKENKIDREYEKINFKQLDEKNIVNMVQKFGTEKVDKYILRSISSQEEYVLYKEKVKRVIQEQLVKKEEGKELFPMVFHFLGEKSFLEFSHKIVKKNTKNSQKSLEMLLESLVKEDTNTNRLRSSLKLISNLEKEGEILNAISLYTKLVVLQYIQDYQKIDKEYIDKLIEKSNQERGNEWYSHLIHAHSLLYKISNEEVLGAINDSDIQTITKYVTKAHAKCPHNPLVSQLYMSLGLVDPYDTSMLVERRNKISGNLNHHERFAEKIENVVQSRHYLLTSSSVTGEELEKYYKSTEESYELYQSIITSEEYMNHYDKRFYALLLYNHSKVLEELEIIKSNEHTKQEYDIFMKRLEKRVRGK